jgi:predicted transcriptional regulator
MQSKKTFLEVLFPKARAEIFRLLFGSKKRPRYVREIMGDSSLALRSIQDELKRLSAVGVVTSHSDGFHRFFAANTAHPLFREITRIAEMSERLPSAKSSELFRASRARRLKRRPKGQAMPFNRPPSWGIFSNRHPKT